MDVGSALLHSGSPNDIYIKLETLHFILCVNMHMHFHYLHSSSDTLALENVSFLFCVLQLSSELHQLALPGCILAIV